MSSSPRRPAAPTPAASPHRAAALAEWWKKGPLAGFATMTSLPKPLQVTFLALSAGLIALVDTVMSALRAPRVPVDAGLALFFVTAWGLVFIAFLPLVVLRAAVVVLGRRLGAEALILGALDWILLGYVAIILQAPNVPARDVQLHAFYLLIPVSMVGYVIVARVEHRFPWTSHAFRLVPAFLALFLASWTHWDRYEYVRVGCLGVFVVAVSSWATICWGTRAAALAGRRVAAVALSLGASALLFAHFALPFSHTGRLVLHSRSAHAQSVLSPVLRQADRDKDGAAALFGGRDCDGRNPTVHPGATERLGNHRDDNCGDGDGKRTAREASRAVEATTPGRDVLLLSFDSLRWDASEHLPQVRRALGSEVEFTRAVSPAPQTFFSLGATIRGKAVREVNFKRSRRLWQDASPTLADLLNAEGYRSFTVLTNQRWAAEYGVTSGFDVVWPLNRAARDAGKPFVDDRFVAAETAFAVALTTARETRGPVLCWLHLMESHYPFHRGARTGPTNRQGFEAALRAVDGQAAKFIEAFREARKSDPIIAVFGDHGEEFGEHGGINHGNTLYSDQVRVGLWLALPGAEGRRVDDPVSIGSIPATILEHLGVEVPKSMTEPSLRDLALGYGSGPLLSVSEMPTPTRYMVSYTGQRYRLVTDAVHDTYELFDMDNDPLEQVNVALAQPEALAEMQRLSREWNERH